METVVKSRWFTIARANAVDEVILCSDEVVIVARDDEGRILLIAEPAYAFGEQALLLPCGAIKSGEDPVEAGHRELREETGFGAKSLRHVGVLRPWPKYLQVQCHVVLADQLHAAPLKGDEAHKITVHPKTRAELDGLIASGEVNDARVIAALALCFRNGR